MSVINTNITSLISQQNLNKSQSALTTAMQRLSSGSRINSAKDDAAGQAIANRMTSSITGLSQAQRNANDGISIAQTAEGALNQVNDNLQRIRELTVQAQNGTNSATNIDSIQQEVNQRLEEINRIAQQTDFNGTKILSKTTDTTINIQVGADDGQQISISISGNTGWNKYSSTGTAAASLAPVGNTARAVGANGFDVLSKGGPESATVDASVTSRITGNTGTVSLVKDSSGALYIKDAVATIDASDTSGLSGGTGTPVFAKDGSGNLYAVDDSTGTAKYYQIDASMVGAGGKVTLDFSAATGSVGSITGGGPVSAAGTTGTVTGGNNYYAVTSDMVDSNGQITAALGSLKTITAPSSETAVTSTSEAVTVQGTSAALKQLDNALKAVDTQRSTLGAIQNRFDSAITNLSTTTTNLSAARSRIQDADYSVEVANMTKAQILQQAGTSVLAQANRIPQSVLSLLQ